MSYDVLRLLPGVAATLSAMLGAVSLLPREHSRQHAFFGLMNLGTYCWSLSYFLGLGAVGWFKPENVQTVGWTLFVIGQIGVVLASTSWLLFSLETVGRPVWTRGWRLMLVCVPGATLLLSLATNASHRLFVSHADWSQAANFDYGYLGTALTVVISALVLVGPVLYVHGAITTRSSVNRRLFLLLSAAGLIPLVGSTLWMTRGLTGLDFPFNPTVVLFTLMNLLLGMAVFRVGLLDIVSIAERSAFHSMRDAGVVVDADGFVAATNRSFTRVFPTVGVGTSFVDAAPGLAVHCEVRAAESQPFGFALDGRTYRVTVSRMTGRGRRSLGNLVVMSDVTEEEAAQARILELNRSLERSVMELEQATHLKDRFIADMSHELRTPLQSIIGFAGALERGLPGDLNPVQQEHVAIILDASRHLAALIESLLDLSRIESGVMVAQARRFDVDDVARRVLETVRPLAGRKDIALHANLCGKVGCIAHSDETKCRQILLNLLGNAIKFTDHGQVELDVDYRGDRVVFVVSDTGPGISHADLPHVFDAFYQGGTDASQSRGAGLGLYVSRTLARLLGGELSVTSVIGKGTAFTLDIPTELPPAGIADEGAA